MFNESNYKQWLGEMAVMLEQKQVCGSVPGEGEWPEDPAEQDVTSRVKLTYLAAVKDWVKQDGTVRLMILLGMELGLQGSYIDMTDGWTLRETLATPYRSKLKCKVIQIMEGLLAITLTDCDDIDTHGCQIDQTAEDYNLCSEPSTSSSDVTGTWAKRPNKERVLYLTSGIPSYADWQFFLELMMGQNTTATLTPDDIVMK